MRGDVGMYAFTGPPQPVEIEHRGVWYRGELLGWRTHSDGRCLARVRCVVGTLRHSAWVNLADLRLPEPGAPAVENPPIDLSPALRRAPRPAAPLPPPPSTAARETVLDDETRPHELLPGLSRRPQPPPAARPLPPPRAYQEQFERRERYSHA